MKSYFTDHVSPFTFFLAISLFFIFTKHTFVGTDDITLWHFLFNGEYRTMIISIPLAWLISQLYQVAPAVPWFSLSFFLVIVYLIYLFTIIVQECENLYLRYVITLFFSLLLIFLWLDISTTSITLLLLIFSFPLLKKHIHLFFISLIIASLFRSGIIISSFPFLFIAFLISSKQNLQKKPGTVGLILLSLGILISNLLLPKMDIDYKEWLNFNEAKSYFVDLHGENYKHILSKDDVAIINHWWLQDELLIPTEKILKGMGTQTDIIKSALKRVGVKKIFNIVFHNPLILFALFLTGFVLFNKKVKRTHKFLLIVFIVGFFMLLNIRNVPRVSFPLKLLWFYILFAMTKEHVKPRYIQYSIVFLSILLLFSLPINKIYGKYKYSFYRDEYVSVVKRHPNLIIENANGFPMPNVTQTIDQLQLHLFDEDTWIYNEFRNVKFAGWTSRHPFFYKDHDISFHGITRKYDTYYDFMTSPQTAYIGANDHNNENIISMILYHYNEISIKKNCQHRIVTIEATPHILLQRIVCDKRGLKRTLSKTYAKQ